MQALILFNISVHLIYLTGKINLTVLCLLPKACQASTFVKMGQKYHTLNVTILASTIVISLQFPDARNTKYFFIHKQSRLIKRNFVLGIYAFWFLRFVLCTFEWAHSVKAFDLCCS